MVSQKGSKIEISTWIHPFTLVIFVVSLVPVAMSTAYPLGPRNTVVNPEALRVNKLLIRVRGTLVDKAVKGARLGDREASHSALKAT